MPQKLKTLLRPLHVAYAVCCLVACVVMAITVPGWAIWMIITIAVLLALYIVHWHLFVALSVIMLTAAISFIIQVLHLPGFLILLVWIGAIATVAGLAQELIKQKRDASSQEEVLEQ